jgi:formiminotetrahydrofolate cyclodeaminase
VTELGNQPLEDFLAAVAEATPAPGGGSSAAVGAGLAAALVEMAARIAAQGESAEVAGDRAAGATEARAERTGRDRANRAAELRGLALRLADRELTSYAPVLEARTPGEREAALAAASEAPAQVAETAADIAELGAEVAASSSPAVRGDALTGVVFAEAAAAAATRLVEINVGTGPVLERARRAAERAVRARASATGHPPPPPRAPLPN